MKWELKDENEVILISEKGEELKFTEIAGIAYNSKYYAILKPKFKFEDVNDDEAVVFEAVQDDKNLMFVYVEDDDIIKHVFDEYYTLLDGAK